MKILSNRLALVLAEYSELPSSVQKVIDGNNKKDIIGNCETRDARSHS